MSEKREDLELELERQKKRRKSIKEGVEKNMEKLDDHEGVSKLGSLRSDEDITGYLRRRREEKR
ncbi:MAG: hypothetical protein V6S10_03220 [Candidatus Methanoglobus sp.]